MTETEYKTCLDCGRSLRGNSKILGFCSKCRYFIDTYLNKTPEQVRNDYLNGPRTIGEKRIKYAMDRLGLDN